MHEAAEEYTHGNHSFLFLDTPLWTLLKWNEKAEFLQWMYIMNTVLKYFVFIVHLWSYHFAVTLCISQSFQQFSCEQKGPASFSDSIDSTLVPAMPWFAFVRLAYSGNKVFRGGPENWFRGELILGWSKLNMHNALYTTFSLHKSTDTTNKS